MGLDTVRVLRRRKIEKSVQAIAQKYDLEISPSSYIWQLSVGEPVSYTHLDVYKRQPLRPYTEVPLSIPVSSTAA